MLLYLRFIFLSSFALLAVPTAQSEVTAIPSQSSFAIGSDGSSSLGTATLQTGADMRFGSSSPNYTIGEGHDILLGRSLGPDEAKLRVALKAPESLTASELAGTWRIYDYEIEEALNFDFATSSEDLVVSSSTFTIDANRRATADLDGEVTFAVNASKNFMVATLSEAGVHSLLIAVRPESGGATSQMAGTWNVGSFGADFSEDPADRWYDGDTMTATSGGAVTLPGEPSATWTANGSGSITFSDPEGSTILSVNQSRSVIAYTETVGEAPTEGFYGAIILRHATTPTIASLEGDWTLLTFELVDADSNNPDVIETYHPDGTTLASRERYTNGQLDGAPAVERWDEMGRQTQKDNYTDDILTYSLQTSYDGEALRSLNEYFYEDGTLISSDEQLYHADGFTVATRVLTTLTEDGLHIVEDTFKTTGEQTHQNVNLDGILRTKIDWNYHSNGNLSSKGINDYTTGVHLLTLREWFENGIKAGIARYRNSKRHGLQEGNDSSGNLVREETYQHGTKHGLERRWYDGGSQLEIEGAYREGKKQGLWTRWYEDGRIATTEEYDEGLRNGDFYTYVYESQDQWKNTTYSVWEYGEERRLETWFWRPSGDPSSHTLAVSEAGDLQSVDFLDYSFIKIFDEQGRLQNFWEYRGALTNHGVQRHWDDGILTEDHFYEQGLQHGRNRRYDAGTGLINFDAYYENDVLHGPYKTYRDGKLYEEGEYVKGQREGVFTTYDPDGGVTSATYRNDILHGPYSSPYSSGEYVNGFEHGIWSYFWDGQLNRKTEYSNGTIHGTEEYFHNGGLSHRERYSDGLLDGLRERFDGGKLSSETTYSQGVEVGPRISYHDNGREASIVNVDAGLAHGSYKAWDDRGRVTTSGSYNHGVQTGTWTLTSYDGEGNADSRTENYGSPNPTTISKGIKGRVTSDGIGLPNVRLTLGTDRFSTTNSNGTFLLEIGDYDGSTQLTISHPDFPDKTVDITLPEDYTYLSRNFTLDEYTSPALQLGEPSMAGTYFLRDVSFPVSYRDLEIPGDEQGSPDLMWRRHDNREVRVFHGFFIDPSIPEHVNDAGYAGRLFTRSAPDLDSPPIDLPTYNIIDNPGWAQSLGKWHPLGPATPTEPGTYNMLERWPARPLNVGFTRAAVDPYSWALWGLVPVLGGEEVGIFDLQATLDMDAYTNGEGAAYLSGGGKLKLAKVESRLNFKGDAQLNWGGGLSLSQAKLLIDAEIDYTDDVTLLTIFPPIPDVGAGRYFKSLNDLVKIGVTIGGGIRSNARFELANGSLGFGYSEAKLSLLFGAQFTSIWLNPEDFEASLKGSVSGTWALENESVNFVDIDSALIATLKWRLFDILVVDVKETYSTEPESSSTKGEYYSTQPRFIQPTFLEYSPYSKFNPQDLVQTHSSSPTPNAAPSNPPLVSNIYPYAEPAIAQHDGQTALAYVHYDPARPQGQNTRIYYSIDSGTGFQTPKPLHTQARADFNPQLAYLADGRLIAIWETSQLDQVATDLEDRIAGLEIAWSLYDSSSDTWSAPTLLTNNAYLDHQVTIANSPNGLMIAWHSNPDNPDLPTPASPDTLNIATWNGSSFDTPTTLGYNVPALGQSSLAYDGTNAVIAWIQDIDEDSATQNDSELFWAKYDGANWTAPQRVTNDDLPDSSPSVFCLQNGNFEIIWLKDNQLVRISNPSTLIYETILPSEENEGAPDYTVDCNANGDIALLWTEYADQKPDLFYSLYDAQNSQWSEAINFTENANQERVPAFSLDDQGNLTAAFLSEDLETEQRDLHWIEFENGIDLAVHSISVGESENDSDQLAISAAVQNNGSRFAANALVAFHLGDPDNGGTLLGQTSLNLLGGQTQNVSIQTNGLAPDSSGTIYVRIDPDNTIAELDETNNTATSELNPPNLAASYFTWDRSVSDETTLTLSGTVTNNGSTEQTDIPAEITDDSGVIYSTTLTSLAPGESASVTTTIDTPAGNEHRFTLSVDPANTLNEPDPSDNTFPLYLSLNQLKDNDGDGMENAWEELNFGTLERDGRGDFDGDGLTDTFEFLTENDPLDETSKFPFTIEPHSTDPAKVLIRFPSTIGRIYRIQRSSDLSEWTNDSFHLGTGEVISVAMDPSKGVRVQIGLQ